MPVTLKTVFARLGATDRFTVHPVCYRCHKIFSPGVRTNTICADCDLELFRPATRQLFEGLDDKQLAELEEGSNINVGLGRKPYMVAPIQLLSVALRDFFARPGMVAAVNGWKTRPTVAGELRSMQDGDVWKTLRGPDGSSFFFRPSAQDELRLGVTFSLDW